MAKNQRDTKLEIQETIERIAQHEQEYRRSRPEVMILPGPGLSFKGVQYSQIWPRATGTSFTQKVTDKNGITYLDDNVSVWFSVLDNSKLDVEHFRPLTIISEPLRPVGASFLHFLFSAAHYQAVLGDLSEVYQAVANKRGELAGHYWLYRQAILSIWPLLLEGLTNKFVRRSTK